MDKLIEKVVNIWPDNTSDKKKYIDEVWQIITNAYAKIGGCNCEKEELFEDNIYWKFIRRDGKITAVCLYKITPYGRKLFLLGSDGTEQGKKDIRQIMQEDVSQEERNFYAEVSETPEYMYLKRGAKPISTKDAQMILGDEKIITPTEEDEYHYTRKIGPQKNIYRKIMLGNPRLEGISNDDDDLYFNADRKRITMNQLTEERSITFDGETSPQFGWCVIIIGGPGSGKSSVKPAGREGAGEEVRFALSKLHLPFKSYDTDELKWLFDSRKDLTNKTIRLPKKDGTGFETVDLTTATVMWPPNSPDAKPELVGEPYDMSNQKYVSFLHERLSRLSKKYMKYIQNMGGAAEQDRLPNVVFDISGDDISKIEDISTHAKEAGYKIALVWVYSDVDTALLRNASRSRKGDDSLIIAKHAAIKETIRQFLRQTYLFNLIDEFWVIVTSGEQERDELGRSLAVYHIESPSDLQDIAEQHNILENFKNYYLRHTSI